MRRLARPPPRPPDLCSLQGVRKADLLANGQPAPGQGHRPRVQQGQREVLEHKVFPPTPCPAARHEHPEPALPCRWVSAAQLFHRYLLQPHKRALSTTHAQGRTRFRTVVSLPGCRHHPLARHLCCSRSRLLPSQPTALFHRQQPERKLHTAKPGHQAYLLINCSSPCLRSSMKDSSKMPSSPRKGSCRFKAFPGSGGTTI